MEECCVQEPILCVLVGDDGSGKTSLLSRYAFGDPDAGLPHAERTGLQRQLVGGLQFQITLDERSYQHRFQSLNMLVTAQADVFLICSSTVQPDSLERALDHWAPVLHYLRPKAPFLIIGTKKDLQTDPETLERLSGNGMRPTQYEDGAKVARMLNTEYVECSALTGEGVDEVFTEAIHACLERPSKDTKKKLSCQIM